MTSLSIARFFADDHERLNALFQEFQSKKESDPGGALKVLEAFRSGLEQHMAWEEAILFGAYDERVPSAEEESPTRQLNMEHQQIRRALEVLLTCVRNGEEDTAEPEARFTRLLASHNRDEEAGFYVELDRRLTDAERADIQRQMKEFTFE